MVWGQLNLGRKLPLVKLISPNLNIVDTTDVLRRNFEYVFF